MIELDRRQLIALSLAFAVIASCILTAMLAVASRNEASQELEDRQARLSQIEAAHARRSTPTLAPSSSSAPETAFVSGATAALAGAQLQTQLTRLVAAQNANLASSGILSSVRSDTADAIRLQVSFDMGLVGLQSVLYALETGTPYVFVEALSIQPRGGTQPTAGEPLLHVTLSVRALWRRTTV
jgi:general secretion pathway protein M